MKLLELRIPPVAIGGMVAVLAWMAPHFVSYPLPLPSPRFFAAVLAFAGLGVALAGVVVFRRKGTSVDPFNPDKASVLVTTGVYRWSRNPMYLGMFLFLLAWAILLADAAALAVTLLFIPWMNRFQIMPEERVMRAKFGDAFDEWAARVRRWI